MAEHDIEALADFVSEVADAVCDLCDTLHAHMPPDAQKMMRETAQRLRRASADYFSHPELAS